MGTSTCSVTAVLRAGIPVIATDSASCRTDAAKADVPSGAGIAVVARGTAADGLGATSGLGKACIVCTRIAVVAQGGNDLPLANTRRAYVRCRANVAIGTGTAVNGSRVASC